MLPGPITGAGAPLHPQTAAAKITPKIKARDFATSCNIIIRGMALVVFLRAANVGGYNTFRPSVLAKELREYDVVNIGAAGTFVVRGKVAQRKLRQELLARLPFPTEVMICTGDELAQFVAEEPFSQEHSSAEVVRFVSVLSKPISRLPSMPKQLPADGDWLLKIIGCRSRFVFGVYRRHMRTIGCLNRLEKLIGMPATTRNWNTIAAIVKLLS
jgi:uncharacterized protein (DUF1697 family)